ncbi:hypothetical protein ACJX0J_009450, partial [Zea mays]
MSIFILLNQERKILAITKEKTYYYFTGSDTKFEGNHVATINVFYYVPAKNIPEFMIIDNHEGWNILDGKRASHLLKKGFTARNDVIIWTYRLHKKKDNTND